MTCTILQMITNVSMHDAECLVELWHKMYSMCHMVVDITVFKYSAVYLCKPCHKVQYMIVSWIQIKLILLFSEVVMICYSNTLDSVMEMSHL